MTRRRARYQHLYVVRPRFRHRMASSNDEDDDGLAPFGPQEEEHFWDSILKLGQDPNTALVAKSDWASSLRQASTNNISLEEQIRLNQFEKASPQKKGLFRMFNLKPPLDITRAKKPNGKFPRQHWSIGKLLEKSNDAFEEQKPIISPKEKAYFNGILNSANKTSAQTSVKTPSLKFHVLSRVAALGIDFASRRRPLLTYVAQILARSNIDPDLWETEIQALLILENLLLKEHEFAYAASAKLPSDSSRASAIIAAKVQEHLQEVRLTTQLDTKKTPPELEGEPLDSLQGLSAKAFVEQELRFTSRNTKPQNFRNSNRSGNRPPRRGRRRNRGRGSGSRQDRGYQRSNNTRNRDNRGNKRKRDTDNSKWAGKPQIKKE